MGLRHGIALSVAQVIEQQAIVLRATPPDLPVGCGVVLPYSAALGGSLPALGPDAGTAATPGRGAGHGAGRTGDRADDAGNAAGNQAQGRASAGNRNDCLGAGEWRRACAAVVSGIKGSGRVGCALSSGGIVVAAGPGADFACWRAYFLYLARPSRTFQRAADGRNSGCRSCASRDHWPSGIVTFSQRCGRSDRSVNSSSGTECRHGISDVCTRHRLADHRRRRGSRRQGRQHG